MRKEAIYLRKLRVARERVKEVIDAWSNPAEVAAFAGHLSGAACYRCFVGDAFDAEDCDTCADDGMLGAMAGWVGSFAAMQAVMALLAGVSTLGAPGWSRLHILDGMEPGMRTIRIPRDPGCKACGTDHA